MKTKHLMLAVIALLSISCRTPFTEQEARKQIMGMEGLPQAMSYEITKEFIKDQNTDGAGVTIVLDEDELSKQIKMLEDFRKNNLVIFTETPHREETNNSFLGTTVRTWTSVKVELTDEGKKYLLKEDEKSYLVKTWDRTIYLINKIEEEKENNDTYQKVYYSISAQDRTPFGQFFRADKVEQKTASFLWARDQWIILSNKPAVIGQGAKSE
jgi:hypothetical protein